MNVCHSNDAPYWCSQSTTHIVKIEFVSILNCRQILLLLKSFDFYFFSRLQSMAWLVIGACVCDQGYCTLHEECVYSPLGPFHLNIVWIDWIEFIRKIQIAFRRFIRISFVGPSAASWLAFTVYSMSVRLSVCSCTFDSSARLSTITGDTM